MKKHSKGENYLERIPVRSEKLTFQTDDKGIVTLAKENTGIVNRIFQKLFKKPKISYIHLDEFGSFIWQITDGKSNIIAIGERVGAHFGEKAQPLYERLARYYQILSSYGFVTFKK